MFYYSLLLFLLLIQKAYGLLLYFKRQASADDILLLLVRSIGLDLKKFGFNEDKEFLETDEADREEVEVEVAFDKDTTNR